MTKGTDTTDQCRQVLGLKGLLSYRAESPSPVVAPTCFLFRCSVMCCYLPCESSSAHLVAVFFEHFNIKCCHTFDDLARTRFSSVTFVVPVASVASAMLQTLMLTSSFLFHHLSYARRAIGWLTAPHRRRPELLHWMCFPDVSSALPSLTMKWNSSLRATAPAS